MLIKQSQAQLIVSPQEIVDFLDNMEASYILSDHHSQKQQYGKMPLPSEAQLGKYRVAVYEAISFSPTSLEQIMLTTGVDYTVLNVLILEMELAGRAERLYGNLIVRLV
jgi:predicted Rossmann fold nucleotide-binding protein DprA/Smf involved in DNA uptake